MCFLIIILISNYFLFRLLSLLLLLHFVVLCFTVYQIEMAIETLQKSEGLSSQRSSLLNSHVSCFSRVLAFRLTFDCARLALLPLSLPLSLFLSLNSAARLFLLQLLIVTIAFSLAAVELLFAEA